MIRRSEVLNLSPASIYKFSYIRTLRRHLCFIKRSLYFYTPRYTPHTLQFFSNSLLFQTQEVQTNPTWCCFSHSKPQKLFHELSFITFIFVELHEQRSVAKVYCIGIKLPLDLKLLVNGGGEQNRLFRLSRTSRPTTMEEFSKQDSYVSKCGPLCGLGGIRYRPLL